VSSGAQWKCLCELQQKKMLPPEARKKLQCWIRSRHLIFSVNFFIFETVEYSAVERFTECVTCLGGALISVNPIKKNLDRESPTGDSLSGKSEFTNAGARAETILDKIRRFLHEI
jgi:hypothetical protein